jgi:hypothetical protein
MTSPSLFFRLQVNHNYFRKRQNFPLDFIPLGTAVMLMSKDLVYLRKRADGFELFLDTTRLSMLPEYLADADTDCLEFIMVLKNRDFLNFTELDIPYGSFLFLKTRDESAISGEMVTLHHAEFVSSDDLTNLSDASAAALPKEFLLKPNSFALIQIPFAKKSRDFIFGDKNGAVISITGSISFRARSTYWRYQFRSKEDQQFDAMQVIDLNGQFTFSEMVAGKDFDGSSMLVTESNERIPLQEISGYHFVLKGTQNGIEHTIISHLAEPGPDFLTRVNGKLSSTIFIYY